ncbi:MAG: hypothetical protein JW809_01565 [Pirellulales bacterium]|nr:hypothetical protein [Pirellulales bacterium]
MKHDFPEYLDILEAVYECHVQQKKPEQRANVTLDFKKIGESLRAKGFDVDNDLISQRLYEYNKTIEIVETDTRGSKTTKYWLCIPDQKAREKNDMIMPFMFQMGTVTNEIAGLRRKRQLEEEQLRFWSRYKWAAIATIALAATTSACAIINCWVTFHAP